MSRRILAVLAALLGAAAVLTPVSAQADDRGTYGISLKVDAGDPDDLVFSGQTIRLAGRVSYGPTKGRSVTLSYRNGSSWKKIGTDKLSKGTFSKNVRLRSGGDHFFRATISGTRHYRGNTITGGPYAVFRYVSGREITKKPTSTLSIGGEDWSAATALRSGESLTFALAGKNCIYGDLDVGLVDGAGTSTSGTASIDVAGSRYARVLPERGRFPAGFNAYFDYDQDVKVTAELEDPEDVMGVIRPTFLCNLRG